MVGGWRGKVREVGGLSTGRSTLGFGRCVDAELVGRPCMPLGGLAASCLPARSVGIPWRLLQRICVVLVEIAAGGWHRARGQRLHTAHVFLSALDPGLGAGQQAAWLAPGRGAGADSGPAGGAGAGAALVSGASWGDSPGCRWFVLPARQWWVALPGGLSRERVVGTTAGL